MTDFSTWTDQQINEAILEAQGWALVTKDIGGGYQFQQWEKVVKIGMTESISISELPHYTHDWQLAGELLEELPADVTTLSKYDDSVDGSDYWECVTGNALTGFSIICVSENPKRAICEAWLAWKEQNDHS